jgi:hypothetical protein
MPNGQAESNRFSRLRGRSQMTGTRHWGKQTLMSYGQSSPRPVLVVEKCSSIRGRSSRGRSFLAAGANGRRRQTRRRLRGKSLHLRPVACPSPVGADVAPAGFATKNPGHPFTVSRDAKGVDRLALVALVFPGLKVTGLKVLGLKVPGLKVLVEGRRTHGDSCCGSAAAFAASSTRPARSCATSSCFWCARVLMCAMWPSHAMSIVCAGAQARLASSIRPP